MLSELKDYRNQSNTMELLEILGSWHRSWASVRIWVWRLIKACVIMNDVRTRALGPGLAV